MIDSRAESMAEGRGANGRERAANAYIPALTGLRGIAASWVLLFHLWQFSGSPDLTLHLGDFAIPFTPLAGCGYMGVDLFFVLSGFLLSLPFHRRDRPPDLIRYGLQRCRRVLPAYYAQIIILVAVFAWYGRADVLTPGNLATHLLLVQNIWPVGPSLNGIYWTMPIEWDFYIVLPVIGLLLTRIRPPLMYIVLFAASVAFRLICYQGFFDPAVGRFVSFGQIMQLPGRLDEFFCGVLGAWIYLNFPISAARARMLIIAGVLGIAAIAIVSSILGHLIYPQRFPALLFFFSLLGIAFGAIVLGAAAQGSRRTLFNNAVVAWLGLISYSLYLWHYPLLGVAQHFGWAATGGVLALLQNLVLLLPPILFVSWLSQHFVERPFLASRRHAHGMPASLES
ncbi:MAG: acyltransferase [Rudaea sp.]